MASFQAWANRKSGGTLLRTDGELDQASYDALYAWAEARSKGTTPGPIPGIPGFPGLPPVKAGAKGGTDSGGALLALAALAALAL